MALLMMAARVYLGRFEHLYTDHTVFSGVTYTEDHYTLTGLLIVSGALVLGAAMALVNAVARPKLRWLMAAVVFGGSLAAGGANTINMYLDRDIDDLMRRTRHRPLPRHAVAPGRALAFGIALSILSFAWLTVTVNLLSALLAASAIAFYVFVYTMWLKRSTPQNIVIGGAAGCVPVLVAWAAVTGTVEVPALVLFAIVFYWTPPHFWALALRYRGDYAAASVPMLPVVRGDAETARQIVIYTILLVVVSLLLFPAARMGLIYLVAAVVLGAGFVWYALRVVRDTSDGRAAIRLFRFSISYLTLLFAAVAADSLLRLAPA